MRGLTMSMDALVAATLMISLISVLGAVRYSVSSPQDDIETFYYNSRDAVATMQIAKLSDIQDFPIIQNLTASGDLTDDDLNKSVLDIVGSYWADGNMSIARNITATFLGGFLPSNFGFDVLLDGVSIYNDSFPPSPFLSRTSFLISGYKKEAAVEGYVSSAWLTKATADDTIIVSISPAGAGYDDGCSGINCGNFTIMRNFELPANATNINASLYMSIHEGNAYSNASYPSRQRNVTVYVNGIRQFYFKTSGGTYNSRFVYNITPGNNTLQLTMERPYDYNAHIHPGFVLEVNYQVEKGLYYEVPRENFKRIYFPYVEGTPAVYVTVPFEIPEGSFINNATLHVDGQLVDANATIEVNDYTAWNRSNPPSNPSVNLTIGNYLLRNGNLSTGETNVVGVYFDTDPNDTTTFYSRAKNKTRILNTSYIELNYTAPERIVKYGLLPVAMITHANTALGGGGKQANFSLPTTYFTDVFLHTVQQYSWEIKVAAWHNPEPAPTWSSSRWSNYTVFSSPSSRNVPADIAILPSRLQLNATNFVNARDTQASDIVLTNTTISYTVFAPVQVGYGAVFPNQTAAVNDAVMRLNATLLEYNIRAKMQDIQYATQAASKVPWMWGPAELEVRLWR